MKTILNELDFWKKAVIIQWNVWKKKDLLLIAYKLIEKIDDAIIAKEYSNSYLKRKKILVNWSKVITQQLKAMENPYIVDIKSVTIVDL